MLKCLNRMSSIHWLLLTIAVFAIMSLGKVIAVVGIVIAGLAVVVRFWSSVKSAVKFLFGGEK